MKLKWPIIIAVLVIVGIVLAFYISKTSTSEAVSTTTELVKTNTPSQPADNKPWIYGILGVTVLGLSAFAFWKRNQIVSIMRGLQGQPSIMEWSCTVKSVQRMGQYSLLISDSLNKTYVLDIGALLAGMQIPKDRWQTVFGEIGEGSELKFRVLTSNFAESQNSAIPILRLNSYTPKYSSSI